MDDIEIPGLLYAKVATCPHPHAIIKSIDTSRAEAVKGVVYVMTYKDCPDWKSGLPKHRKVLDQHLRYVGDATAIIAAETRQAAEEAATKIDIEYEVLPYVLTPEEALKPDAPQLYEEFPGNVIPKITTFSREPFNQIFTGNVEEAFKESAYIAEGDFSYDRLPHPLPPESPGCIAEYTGSNQIKIYYNGGCPHLMKLDLEDSIPGATVRCIALHAGGSYGSKQKTPHLAMQAIAMAKVTRRPVKLQMDKNDHMLMFELREGSRIKGKIGITEDGIINAIQGMWYIDSGMSSTYAQAMTAVGLGEAQAFCGKCKNWALDTVLVATNHSSQAPIRGFGGQELKSAMIPLVCTAIRKGGFDPLAVFKKNFVKKGDSYIWRDAILWDVKSVDFRPAIEASAEKFGWEDKWKGWEKPYWVSEDGKFARGVGVGVHGNADIGEDPTEGIIKLHPFGSVTVEMCIAETGGSQRHAVQKMVAEIMNVPFEGVQLVDADTHGTGYDAGLIGSRGTITMGTCAVRAAKMAKRKLLQAASELLNIGVDELETENYMIYQKGRKDEVSIPWIEAFGTPERTIIGIGNYEQNFDKLNFALYLADVEVNLQTGEAKLINALMGTDVGQIIDPINVRMQAEGAFGAAGSDTALFEEMVMDSKLGRFVNGNMIDYKWRTFNEFPKFDTVILESQFDTESFHAIGFGEITGSPGPSAILMAASNAIGKEIKEYPLTPDVVLRAMGKISKEK